MNEALLQYLLESAAGLTLLFLFYALVLRKETCFQFNRFYLLAALFLSFVVPLSNLPGISLWPQPAEQEVLVEAALEPMAFVASQEIVVPQEAFNYWNLLYGVYGIGVLFFAARFLIQVVRLRRFAKQEGTSFFLPNQAPVILTHGQYPTFSFWRWVFFDNSQTLTPDETERVLQHEQVHIDQRHTLDVLLVSLASIIFWFNPLLVLFKKALEQTHEFIADAHVARASGPSAYSSLLVKQVFRNADFPLGSYFFLNKSLTLTRIKMMKKLHQSPKLSRMLLVIPALALFLTAVAAMRPVSEEEVSESSIGKGQEGAAQFPGGREALNAYVKSHLVLPEVAFQKRKSAQDFVKVTGTIEVEVQEDGTAVYRRTVDLEVRPNHPDVVSAVTKQFAQLVSQMPRWTPAQKDGKAVPSKEMISVSSTGGNFLNYQSYLESHQQKTSVSSETLVPKSTVTKRAEYPGGKGAVIKYINDRFVLPEVAFNLKKEGAEESFDFTRIIEARVFINEEGTVTKVQPIGITTSPGNSPEVNKAIEKEFLRVASKLPNWTPAYSNGKAVASVETLHFGSSTNYGKRTYNQIKSTQEKVAERANVPATSQPAPEKDDKVFIAVEKMPEFPGGQAAMFKYLKENTAYPEDAKQAKISGIMVASFIVNAQGKVTKVEVLKKLHPSLDRAFEKVLQNMPLWMPGTQNGKAVAVKYTIPFRVEGEAMANNTNEPNFNPKEKVYIAVEQMPEFPGGTGAMFKYLGENFVIPAEDKAKGTEGTIVASFVVTKEGKITKVQLMKGVSPGLDQEVIRLLGSMPNWKPGTQNGKAVAVKYTVPYRVVLKKDIDKPATVPDQKNK